MAEARLMDHVYHYTLETFVTTGQAPHYTDIAKAFSVQPEEGKRLLHELMGTGIPAWLYDDTDYIASFGPFNNVPTQYRITVEEEQRWFGQCGFESLAVCWLFPGKSITIDAPCLDCGEPLCVTVRDGVIDHVEPEGIFAFVDIPFRQWRPHLAHS